MPAFQNRPGTRESGNAGTPNQERGSAGTLARQTRNELYIQYFTDFRLPSSTAYQVLIVSHPLTLSLNRFCIRVSYTVPMKFLCLGSFLASPKSMILSTPSTSRKFSGLMSRCTIRLACTSARAWEHTAVS